MLNIFTTQLTGLFKKISEEEEYSMEDAARLLAQAPIGDGSIYIFGTKEMKAVANEAMDGAEPLKGAKLLDSSTMKDVTEADRILLLTRYSSDDEAKEMASILWDKGIPFVAVSTIADEEGESPVADLADVHIDLRLTKGLLSDEFGNRFGLPTSMAALFVYYGLKLEIDEMLSEYDL